MEDQCIECGTQIEQDEEDASDRLFGKLLCWCCMEDKVKK